MLEIMLAKDDERIFRKSHLFSREDVIKSFRMFIDHFRLNEYPKSSPEALLNRLKLCERFLDTLERCRLPVLTELWNFYEYSFLVNRIMLELCDASEIEIENDEISSMISTVEHTLLNVECNYLSVEKFAEMHNVDSSKVNQWIHRGKLRYAKKTGQEWLVPDTEDKPGRRFEEVRYLVMRDEQIISDEFPTLTLAETVYIYQDTDDRKKYIAFFLNYKTDYRCKLELTKIDVERLEYIIIESGKAKIEGDVQYVPNIHEDLS